MEKPTQIFTIIKSVNLSVNLVDSVFRTAKNYYPQELLEEFVVKEKNMWKYITDDTEISDDSPREDFDKEISNEANSDE